VLLTRLDQFRTYGGLLLGFPNELTNASVIREVLERAAEGTRGRVVPQLVEPEYLPYRAPVQAQLLGRGGELVTDGPVTETVGQRLPLVACIAHLECPELLHPPEPPSMFTYSTVTLVWFQERYAFPIVPVVVDYIKGLDWRAVAVDVSD
jgi:hypothetical protein